MADPPGSASIQAPLGFASTITIQGLTAGQSVLVRGFEIVHGFTTFLGSPAIFADTNAGAIWIEECSGMASIGLLGTNPVYLIGGDGLLALNSAGVVVARCHLIGGGNASEAFAYGGSAHGVHGIDSEIYVYDSILEGAPAPPGAACGAGTTAAGHVFTTGFELFFGAPSVLTLVAPGF